MSASKAAMLTAAIGMAAVQPREDSTGLGLEHAARTCRGPESSPSAGETRSHQRTAIEPSKKAVLLEIPCILTADRTHL